MIWLLRHAEAEDGSPDAERKLTPKGRRQARTAGRALAKLGAKFDGCLTSPKVRALQTAELACKELGIEPQLEPKLAGGPFDPEQLAAGLGENVLLVGHDPDFSAAVHTLTGAQVRLRKGGVAAIDDGELVALARPAELKAMTS